MHKLGTLTGWLPARGNNHKDNNMNKSQTVFFTGHRDFYHTQGSRAFDALEYTIGVYIKKGYKYFVAGGAIGFDTMAAECVLKLKSEGADISLILMLPCYDQDAKWKSFSRQKYRKIISLADKVIYTAREYSRGCMLARNRAMADCSAACIAYYTKPTGGTAYTLDYASKKGLIITNIAHMF